MICWQMYVIYKRSSGNNFVMQGPQNLIRKDLMQQLLKLVIGNRSRQKNFFANF